MDPLFVPVNMVRPVEMQHTPSGETVVNANQVRQPGVYQHKDGVRAMIS